MVVKVTFSDITDEEQKVLFDEFGYIIALMWRDYLQKGGDPNILIINN
ncbi:hypothetical protein [Cellulosilyticum sp. WCF-2]|nr:hypothetical protein [Cellulosilyticum sp. WCF-2]